ncbi:hypothetical protein M0802_006871 [Mischocyttarus mexicanus]|nr:hypothetical protein M0802_006871 [Mischocyttarus mexicanus]
MSSSDNIDISKLFHTCEANMCTNECRNKSLTSSSATDSSTSNNEILNTPGISNGTSMIRSYARHNPVTNQEKLNSSDLNRHVSNNLTDMRDTRGHLLHEAIYNTTPTSMELNNCMESDHDNYPKFKTSTTSSVTTFSTSNIKILNIPGTSNGKSKSSLYTEASFFSMKYQNVDGTYRGCENPRCLSHQQGSFYDFCGVADFQSSFIKERCRKCQNKVDEQRNEDKLCEICFKIEMEKLEQERQFGILENCDHCFCLSSVKTKSRNKGVNTNITKTCIKCNFTTKITCPTNCLFVEKDKKKKFINDSKGKLSKKICKFFNKGKCTAGDACLYEHVLLKNTKAKVDRNNSKTDNEIDSVRKMLMNDFIPDKNGNVVYIGFLKVPISKKPEPPDSNFESD